MDKWREGNNKNNVDFKQVFESIPTPYLILDSKLTIVDANDAYLNIIKTHRENIIHRNIFEIFPDIPEISSGIKELKESLERVLATKKSDIMVIQKFNIQNPEDPNGPLLERYWQLSNYPVLNKAGKIVTIIHDAEDVSDYIQMKNKAHHTEDSNIQLKDIRVFLESVLENLPMMVFIKEAKTLSFIKINKAGENLLGISEKEIYGKNDYDFFPKEEADFFVENDKLALAEGHVYEIPKETIHTKKLGVRILHTRKVPIFDQDHNPLYILGISEDITEKVDLIEAQLAKKSAEEMADRKSRFVDIAAHELRTPVTSLKLLLQLAIRQTQKGKPLTVDVLSRVREPAERLSRLVIDLLDASRIERGLLSLIPVETNLTQLIGKSIEDFELQYPERSFIYHHPEKDLLVMLDPLRINQVMVNLLDNAVKYAVDGEIEVTLEDEAQSVKISVTDHGPGISDEQKKILFLPFNRGSSDSVMKTSGLGLGLSVCLGIIRLHGGDMGVDSSPGKGATFYFILPKDIKESIKLETNVLES